MKFFFNFPIFDHLADVRLLADLAADAEEAGWDRVLVWDHVNFSDYGLARGGPHVDPWIALALMADRTERIELGTCVTPVPRRRPVKLAREILTLHDLSGGRFVFGAGIGAGTSEFDRLGEETDWRTRGRMLDEGLDILQAVFAGAALDHHGEHYTAVSEPMIDAPVAVPIILAGTWPNPRPFTRAARFDGAYAVRVGFVDPLGTDDVAAIRAHVSDHRTTDAPFELGVSGRTSADVDADRRRAEELEAAGATTWVDGTVPRFESLDDARTRMRLGTAPPLNGCGPDHPDEAMIRVRGSSRAWRSWTPERRPRRYRGHDRRCPRRETHQVVSASPGSRGRWRWSPGRASGS